MPKNEERLSEINLNNIYVRSNEKMWKMHRDQNKLPYTVCPESVDIELG